MKIGLTQRVLIHKGQAHDSLDHSWYDYLQGHTLVSIPNRLCLKFPEIDLLVITGGDDHPIRNQIEHQLVDSMLSRNLPVIGVCHGCQLLTQRLHGSLVPVTDHQDSYHEVFYQDESHLVNSYHKLRIEQAPPGATVLARDPDGYVEAWIQDRIAGVMWHPERMSQPWIPEEIEQLLTR
jgi:gamma-glutamyl-gamma-aminobutyrate hydrolase PuuD